MRMLFFLIFIHLLNINLVFSGTYKIEAYFDTKVSGDTKLPDNRTYRTFSLDGVWKDSLGDWGKINCAGNIIILYLGNIKNKEKIQIFENKYTSK